MVEIVVKYDLLMLGYMIQTRDCCGSNTTSKKRWDCGSSNVTGWINNFQNLQKNYG